MAKIELNEQFNERAEIRTVHAEQQIDVALESLTNAMKSGGPVAIVDFIAWAIDKGFMEFNITNGNATLDEIIDQWMEDQE